MYKEYNDSGIHDLFVGKSVRKVGENTLELSDGTKLRLHGNIGGCICGAGDYELIELNNCDNIITNVEIEARPDSDYGNDPDDGYYRIFVFADNKRINLATFEGTDGNGYYGTGFWIEVVKDG